MALIVIPARYASTRFPGKPLADIGGKSMIRRVYERCLLSVLAQKVLIATDDRRIYDHAAAFGAEVIMTRSEHPSGTDRVAEAAAAYDGYARVVNVQGDEPFIEPAHIDRAIARLADAEIATLVCPIRSEAELRSPDVVKAVCDIEGKALYFSRLPIPFLREGGDESVSRHPYLRHIGLYAFRREALLKVAGLPPAPLEQAEALEQLRWLYHGLRIATALVDQPSPGIDRPEDLRRLGY